uniref:Uncharacterized protein n=1 Tax=Parastrongyloides trichosuri TaxID=131310 RepID=A0A0N4ZD19_PARTI
MNRPIVTLSRHIYPRSKRFIRTSNSLNKDSDNNNFGENNSSFIKTSIHNNQQSKTLHTTSIKTCEFIKPTDFQKKLFLLTGIYKNSSEIPELVSDKTINQLNSESRQLIGVGICLVVVTILYTMEFDMANGSENNKTSLYHLSKTI